MAGTGSPDCDNTIGARLRRLPGFGTLPDELLDELGALGTRKTFPGGYMVADVSEQLTYVGFVLSGMLRMQRLTADGSLYMVGLLVEGDMFGRIFDGPLHFSIEAAVDTELCVFPRKKFEDLAMRSPKLERLIMLNILNELDAAREWMLILTSHRITERLAGFLLLLCRRWGNIARVARHDGGPVTMTIPLSRTDLANFLGTRPESLSRAFHALASDGLIRLSTPYEIEMLDVSGLLDLSGTDEVIGAYCSGTADPAPRS